MKQHRILISRIYHWINMLSIDVCLGALAGGIMASQILKADPGWAYWIVLPLAVWLIYTSDHLIDGFRAGNKAIKDRYVVHRKYHRQFIFFASLILLISVFISFLYLSNDIIIFGIILGSMAAIYLVLVFILPGRGLPVFQKEVAVAFFYTAGIWGPVIISGQTISWTEWAIVALFYILALCDLIMLSLIEMKVDDAEGQRSLPILFGTKHARRLLHLLLIVVMAFSALLIFTDPSWMILKAALILGMMALCLLIIFRLSDYLKNNDLYRYISEAVFVLPALMLI